MMKRKPLILRMYNFYPVDFREMIIGKTLGIIIPGKLFIMFFISKLFFFLNFLGIFKDKEEKYTYVSPELIQYATNP